ISLLFVKLSKTTTKLLDISVASFQFYTFIISTIRTPGSHYTMSSSASGRQNKSPYDGTNLYDYRGLPSENFNLTPKGGTKPPLSTQELVALAKRKISDIKPELSQGHQQPGRSPRGPWPSSHAVSKFIENRMKYLGSMAMGESLDEESERLCFSFREVARSMLGYFMWRDQKAPVAQQHILMLISMFEEMCYAMQQTNIGFRRVLIMEIMIEMESAC
ncbi:hypothetical protein QBC38DRAFT_523661, partial [Podospora fimiseda]